MMERDQVRSFAFIQACEKASAMAEFQRSDLRKYLPNPEKPRDELDKPVKQPTVPTSVEFVEPKVAAIREKSSPNLTPKAPAASGVTPPPFDTLKDLRTFVESGQLDGRPLVVLAYAHSDIGAVVRKHFASMSAAGLNPEFYKRQLQAILAALTKESR